MIVKEYWSPRNNTAAKRSTDADTEPVIYREENSGPARLLFDE